MQCPRVAPGEAQAPPGSGPGCRGTPTESPRGARERAEATGDLVGHRLHVVLAVLGTAGLLGIVYSRKRQMTIALVMFCGFVFGPVFPVLIAILLKPMATEVSGRAVGFLFAGASIGWTLIPPLIGRIAERTNLQRGFLVAVASSVIFLGLVIAHYIYHAQ